MILMILIHWVYSRTQTSNVLKISWADPDLYSRLRILVMGFVRLCNFCENLPYAIEELVIAFERVSYFHNRKKSKTWHSIL